MEIKKENKFKRFFKRYGVLSLACVFSLVIALSIAISAANGDQPVSTVPLNFAVPMKNAVVVKDYADDRLQYNDSLKRWEIHLAVDLASEDNVVCAVTDGVVTSVSENSLDGNVIKIKHDGGFESVYSSLSDEIKVKTGDKVSAGQNIANASNSASNESKTGGHLHFMLLKNGVEVDPNNYLDLQNK